jgi:hypothetical protein
MLSQIIQKKKEAISSLKVDLQNAKISAISEIFTKIITCLPPTH